MLIKVDVTFEKAGSNEDSESTLSSIINKFLLLHIIIKLTFRNRK